MSEVVTLKQNSDFRRAYSRGKSFADPALVTYCVRNRAGICRVGITTSKKLGGAVERNRCRRIILAAYRSLLPECRGCFDLVFVARSRALKLKSTDLQRVMRRQLCGAGVIARASEDKL